MEGHRRVDRLRSNEGADLTNLRSSERGRIPPTGRAALATIGIWGGKAVSRLCTDTGADIVVVAYRQTFEMCGKSQARRGFASLASHFVR